MSTVRLDLAGATDPSERIRRLINAGDLAAIERLVDDVFCEPLNTAEISADGGLDAGCQEIGAASLAWPGSVTAVHRDNANFLRKLA